MATIAGWNLKSTRPADIVKLLGSAVTAGKSSNRVGRRCNMVVEDTVQWDRLVMMVRSNARMVDLSPVQPGVPSSITTGDSPPLLGRTFDLSFSFRENIPK